MHEIEQALRKSHCDRKDQGHECCGTITIGPKGITLNCPLCGKDTINAPARYGTWTIEQARMILSAAGLEWDALTGEHQVKVLDAVEQSRCTFCGCLARTSLYQRTRCNCGARWDHYSGWQRPSM